MANLGRVYDGVEYPLRHEACKARHRAYVQALAEGLNFTQAAHTVGVSKRTGKVWRNGRTRSSGRCERASIADWHRQGISMRQIAQRLGRSVSTVSRTSSQ